MSQPERIKHDNLADLIASIPAEWTAFEIRSSRARTKFMCELSRRDWDAEAGEEAFITGRGSTITAAVLDALAQAA